MVEYTEKNLDRTKLRLSKLSAGQSLGPSLNRGSTVTVITVSESRETNEIV